MSELLRRLLFSGFLMLLPFAAADAQYVEYPAPFSASGDNSSHHTHAFSHSAAGLHHYCSVDKILTDSASVRALNNYRELRRVQPEGALVETLLQDYNVGDSRNFRVRNLVNNSWRTVTFTLKAKNNRLRIWVEDGEFAPDQVNQEVIDELMQVMINQTPELSWQPESGIIDISETVFGQPPNIDGSGVLNILITDVIDGWEPDGDGGTVAGFFDPVDLDPSNSNSNQTDIIYLNSRPIIYFDGNVNTTRVRSVAAHEYQHLIHANYGNLHIFQNEGQSEWAELLTGFSGRIPNYLSQPREINIDLFTWRRNSTDVLLDYQRASLLHSYLAQRLGVEDTGAITRSTSGSINAYTFAAMDSGLDFGELLTDFHVANFINDRSLENGRFGYEDIRRRAYGVTFPTFQYFSGQNSASASRGVRFGGAEYIEWIGTRDLELSLSGANEASFTLIAFPLDPDQDPEITPVSPGTHTLSGDYERVVLAAVGAEPIVQTVPTNFSLLDSSPGEISYSYNATWESLPIITQTLNYAGQPAAFQELPGTPGNPDREGIRRVATRFSPELDSRVSEVRFTVNGRDSSLIGSGEVRIGFHRATGSGNNIRPGMELGFVDVPLSQLSRGENRINVGNRNWQVNGGSEYYIVFEVTGSNPRVEFLVDGGSTNTSNPNYFPPRTRLFVEPPSSNSPAWFTFSNNNNLVASVRITGEYIGPLDEPQITSQPQSRSAELGEEVSFSVSATGTPEPIYQWYLNGEPIYGEDGPELLIASMSFEDEGEYTVRVSNPAGSVLSDVALLTAGDIEFQLAQNFPNPVRDRTTIEFILPEQASVTLLVFDYTGRQVARLIQSQTREAGVHQVTFRPEGLASGVYFYQLRASATASDNSFRRSGKMLLYR